MSIDYKIIRSSRKSIAIYVHRSGQVEVRAPKKVPESVIHAFVREKRHWIEKKQSQWQSLPPIIAPEFKEGSEHYFLGEPHRISFSKVTPGEPLISLKVKDESEDSVKNALERWYRKEAKTLFEDRYEHWLEQLDFLDLPQSTLALRKMKRRWGSCSRRRVITLNTHLVRYPLDCVDAVIVHELCHLLEFNHSARFYRLMDMAYPKWKSADAMLKRLSFEY
ncbi:MAG: M48 family metallopeptidase [Pseudomonadales bacterium]|nr:M48 family metallopeptidase [Pseudomonadales bacterium]